MTEITIFYNHVAFNVTKSSSGLLCTDADITSQYGGTNPVCITSSATGEPNEQLVDSETYRVSLCVGRKVLDTTQIAKGVQDSPSQQQVQLYLSSILLNNQAEQSLLSKPVKSIVYNDLQHYLVRNITSGGTFQEHLTSGLSKIREVIIIPQLEATSNSTGSGEALTCMLSPFLGGTHASPFCFLTNLQVRIGGEPLFANPLTYNREQYYDHFAKTGINGGMTYGLGSSVVSRNMWDCNPILAFKVRTDPLSDSVPRSVQIEGTNLSKKNVLLHIFLVYEKSLQVDCLTGMVNL